ncbi:hypothetical protein RZS08_46765, partial [Arthrospira platensis SPKY1]|nr:hypothetical protein [Arthrospira platensis SPKY1]
DIISGQNADGVSFLKLFLIDYSREFSEFNLCASCENKLVNYHAKWCKRFKIMGRKCDYRLKLKYEGIQLEFGSTVFVTNENLTNEIGAKLLKEKGEHLFDLIPEPKPKKVRNAKVQE